MLRLFRTFITSWIPQYCVLCNHELSDYTSYPLCQDCEKTLQQIADPVCKICGKPLVSEHEICMECRATHAEFDSCSAVYLYKSSIQSVIVSYKGKGMKTLAFFFAKILHNKLCANDWIFYPLVPVPPRKGKIKKQGWDQVALITAILKKHYKVPVCHILERKQSTVEQKKLNRQERAAVISGQFSVKQQNMKIPETVVLLDDISTTGATLNECAKILKAHGCKKIYVMVIALD